MATQTSLISVFEAKLESGDVELPVLNPVALDLRRILSKDNYRIDDVADIVSEDMTLASQLLRLANSAFFGGNRSVSTVKEAIVRIGARQVTDVVTMLAHEANFRSKDPRAKEYMKTLWEHSVCCAAAAKWLAEKTGHVAIAGEAFLGGLFHDIGELLVVRVVETIDSGSVLNSKSLLLETMKEAHADLGAELLDSWELPEIYCEIAKKHHGVEPTRNLALSLVRVADRTCDRIGMSLTPDPNLDPATPSEIEQLGLTGKHLETAEIVAAAAIGKYGAVV